MKVRTEICAGQSVQLDPDLLGTGMEMAEAFASQVDMNQVNQLLQSAGVQIDPTQLGQLVQNVGSQLDLSQLMGM